jgi:hypothetical protein
MTLHLIRLADRRGVSPKNVDAAGRCRVDNYVHGNYVTIDPKAPTAL